MLMNIYYLINENTSFIIYGDLILFIILICFSLNTDILIFEGEYLNGKRNGKGKEYYENGKLKFKGKYINGERNGKWKEYYDNGHLQFEVEYLNGKRWKGKGYSKNGLLEFEIKNGFGKWK